MISIIASSAPGLSPLARGTLTAWYAESHPERFIPAGAGNTSGIDIFAPCEPVYPRWRGEHSRNTPTRRAKNGLSPLARGTHCGSERQAGYNRFIPAGAGNTGSTAGAIVAAAVYPRWRGEHSRSSLSVSRITGLSPLARGTREFSKNTAFITRFIPAGAGNTSTNPAFIPDNTVYPRWRGEHYGSIDRPASNSGLSPLARGTH
ncbi:hypothetical protein EC970246_2535 [Escherichia coli 97.0246]|uniref:Uncharacterized protein n=1 Tax=Escherichia coli 97.0246 TaxID=869670 RepID=A0A8E0FP55_ECOLX|nr:hypothetical protein EC970246_2535 [Escherichia coli 97.0246]